MSLVPEHFTVWAEIPVTDLEASRVFYEKVTGGHLDPMEMGTFKTAVFRTTDFDKGIAGHLYEGQPSADGRGPTVHILVEGTVEEACARAKEAGATVLDRPIVEIPVGRFGYITDLDGNSIGLFQPTTGG